MAGNLETIVMLLLALNVECLDLLCVKYGGREVFISAALDIKEKPKENKAHIKLTDFNISDLILVRTNAIFEIKTIPFYCENSCKCSINKKLQEANYVSDQFVKINAYSKGNLETCKIRHICYAGNIFQINNSN